MYNSNYYYEYTDDFPQGNGWRNSSNSFQGEIINSKNYVFERGKYQGRSLQQVIGRAWKGICKYIDYGLIYITNDTFNSLKCNVDKLRQLRVATDAKLSFKQIKGIDDELCSHPFDSWYQGKTFYEVAKCNPSYLWELIFRCYNSVHGDKSRYYATDHGLPIENVNSIISQLNARGFSGPLLGRLGELSDEFRYQKEEAMNYKYDQWEREMNRQMIEDGYREAYNDDPETIWNTD